MTSSWQPHPWRWWAPSILLCFLAACSSGSSPPNAVEPNAAARLQPSPTSPPPGTVMPDLIGMSSKRAAEVLGELNVMSSWEEPVAVRCQTRPGTVLRQRPVAGASVSEGRFVHIRVAAFDLDQFRGPCEVHPLHVGHVSATDAAAARQFYRFASNPSLGASFASDRTWVGIEDGPTGTVLSGQELADLTAWQTEVGYAETSGPLSALDFVARSGGYYEIHNGVVGTCPNRQGIAPPHLASFRAVSLTAREDVTSSCLDWWGVTLFLDAQDHIRGVALRLGSP